MAPAAEAVAPSPQLPVRVVLSVFLPFASGYFLSYIFRSVNAVIAPDLVGEFSLTAADLGLLTSAYFLAFASFQVPLGILLDRIGPRRTNASLLLVAGTGALLFASGEGMPGLLAGRALIGFGVSACLMSSIKAFTLWFPLERLPAVTGWVMFTGGIGAMVATAPVEAALQFTTWRGVFVIAAGCTFLAAAALFFVAPERPSAGSRESLAEQLRGVARVFGSGTFWSLAAASALFQATNMAIQGLWAGPWLADVAGYDRRGVALSLLGLAAATTVGFLGWGVAASRLAARGFTPLKLFRIGTSVFLATQLLLCAGVTSGAWLLWALFGLSGTSGSLAFTILSHTFPMSMTGRANTALNLLVFLTAFACQWAIGAVVNLWPAAAGHYHPEGYRAAFAVFIALQGLAFGWLMFGAKGPVLRPSGAGGHP
jgi:predicted MFS family arabinose efflux permease